MNIPAERRTAFAPVVLRLGLALVFLLFGMQKLVVPEQTRAEIQLLLNLGLGTTAAINYYFGLLELLVALGFFFGAWIRTVSVIAALSLLSILASFFLKYGTKMDPTLYRDLGLLGGALSLWLTGAGPWSLDHWRARRRSAPPPTP